MLTQIEMNFTVAIDATAFEPELFDESHKPFVVFLSGRIWLIDPGAVPTTANFHHVAQVTWSKFLLMCPDKGIPHWDSLAKYAVAFFRRLTVGHFSLTRSVKFLRVLQEKEIRRIGDNKTRPVGFRIISATNRNLSEELQTTVPQPTLSVKICSLEEVEKNYILSALETGWQ